MGEPIFTFNGLKQLLTSMGYNVGNAKPYQEIAGRDVIITNGPSNEVECPSGDGFIYIDSDGTQHFGFLYKRSYDLAKFGNPRMHVCECDTIRSYRLRGLLDHEYRFAETRTVKVLDKSRNGMETEVGNLPLCKYCIQKRFSEGKFQNVSGFDDFARIATELRNQNVDRENDWVDIFGYVKDWEMISRRIREESNYTCERCGLRIDDVFDRQFIHVHHKDGNKTNNKNSNLQCLCIECHSQVDDTHRRNFSGGGRQVQLEQFRTKYRNGR